jgi:hypothetical protein
MVASLIILFTLGWALEIMEPNGDDTDEQVESIGNKFWLMM